MKIIEKWNEVDRRQAGAGMQVLYELGGYRIAVSDASYERIKMLKAMEFIARNVNNESFLNGWLALGVADGDIEYGDLSVGPDDADELEYYMEDEPFADLMDTFLRCMAHARRDGGLYCDGVVSKEA